MINIEQYDNYRKYLQDYYEAAKKKFPYFSYRYFCRKSGINSPAFYKSVANGQRNLTDKTIPAFIKGLGLNARQGKFFTALVHFSQAKKHRDKQVYLEQLRGLTSRVSEKVLPIDYYAYYSKWYNVAIRELACLLDWKDDYALLAKAVYPPIKAREAQEAVELLLKLGLLEKGRNGRYRQTAKHVTTQSEVASTAIRNINHQFSQLGASALLSIPPSRRDISSLTVGISGKTYEFIKLEIQYFIERIKLLIEHQESADKVYNINVHMFPMSGKPEAAGGEGHE